MEDNIKSDINSVECFFERLGEFLNSLKAPISVKYQIGISCIQVNFFTKDLFDFFSKAVNHLQTDLPKTDLRLAVIERKSLIEKLPRPFWSWDQIDSKGNIQLGDPDLKINYNVDEGILHLLSYQQKVALIIVQDLQDVQLWHRSFPFRTIIDWWFEKSTLQAVHAACLAVDNSGFLLAGPGGSGKSTTALTGLLHGLKFLGDDFVLVDTENPLVHSLYSIAKLNQVDLKNYTHLKSEVLPNPITSDEKVQIALFPNFSGSLKARVDLKSILVPRIVNEQKSFFKPCSSAKAFFALAPSTINLLNGNRAIMIEKISTLVRSIPCYEFGLGSGRKNIISTLEGVIREF